MTCSQCGKRFDADQSASKPFCGRRCQLIDLGRWLNEDVAVPHEGGDQNGNQSDDPIREIRFDGD